MGGGRAGWRMDGREGEWVMCARASGLVGVPADRWEGGLGWQALWWADGRMVGRGAGGRMDGRVGRRTGGRTDGRAYGD